MADGSFNGFFAAYPNFSVPNTVEWIALVSSENGYHQILDTVGSAPSYLTRGGWVQGAPLEAVVIPCTPEWDLWVRIKGISQEIIGNPKRLQEYMDRLQAYRFHEMIDHLKSSFRPRDYVKQVVDEYLLSEKTSQFFERLIQSNRYQLLETAARSFVDLLGFQRCAVFLYLEHTQELQGVLGHNLNSRLIKRIREPVYRAPFLQLILFSKLPVYLPDVSGPNGLPEEYVKRFHVSSLVVVPFVYDDTFIGGVLLDQGGKFFEPSGETLHSCVRMGERFSQLIKRIVGDPFNIQTTLLQDPNLSPREIEVLQLASLGESSKQIADHLRLSEHTINEYLTSATEKLQAKNRTQAVAIALRRGIIQ